MTTYMHVHEIKNLVVSTQVPFQHAHLFIRARSAFTPPEVELLVVKFLIVLQVLKYSVPQFLTKLVVYKTIFPAPTLDSDFCLSHMLTAMTG